MQDMDHYRINAKRAALERATIFERVLTVERRNRAIFATVPIPSTAAGGRTLVPRYRCPRCQ